MEENRLNALVEQVSACPELGEGMPSAPEMLHQDLSDQAGGWLLDQD